MPLTKLTTNLNNISALGDSPNTAPDSLTATQMKAKFDKSGSDIKTYNNDTLTVEIDAAITALDSAKINVADTELYNDAGGIADGATNITVTGLSDYHLYKIETDTNSITFDAVRNNAGTRISGLGIDITSGSPVTIHLTASVSGDVISTLYIKNITHIPSGAHSAVGTGYKVIKIYGKV